MLGKMEERGIPRSFLRFFVLMYDRLLLWPLRRLGL